VPDAELDEGRVVGERADRVSFGDGRALRRADLAEVRERDRPAVGGLDRQRPPAPGHRAGKRDGAGCGSVDRRAGVAGDVDTPVLAGGVRVRGVEREGRDDTTVRRPRPGVSDRGDCERDRESEQESVHGNLV